MIALILHLNDLSWTRRIRVKFRKILFKFSFSFWKFTKLQIEGFIILIILFFWTLSRVSFSDYFFKKKKKISMHDSPQFNYTYVTIQPDSFTKELNGLD